ncbi:hypothetical protein I5Q34_29645 [Streptomyces sp. AV19]|uniref:DUF6247 family protein n=1 Tax=Streptomyces sp. AV19 TaxID=2793068 RepID=UPI0018FEA746|nr:DUF6247 family protein [Streptomyces sp. AV19]MBH1938373.1 hypothetical protein [Streptomyces sp. AV19]MDG4535022.1 DUF6247 family protein [Streptomyces sp. AV19]
MEPIGSPRVPPMPERTPKALRAAISQHTPDLLPDFDAHWKKYIADAYDLAPVPAFMMRWWVEFAIARNPELDAHLHDLETRAGAATTNAEAQELLEEAARIRHALRSLEPGE